MPLLKEYARKLRRFVYDASAVWGGRGSISSFNSDQEDRITDLVRTYQYLQQPLRELIARGSAVLEEGRLTDIERLELHIRQAEIEAQFLAAESAVQRIKPYARNPGPKG
jgi:hypothetical protein